MKKSFDDILNECIRRIESGEDIESVLRSYAEHADELRPHLEVWASLSAVEKVETTPQGALQGRQQLLNALATVEHKEGGTEIMKNLSTAGSLSLKLIGAASVVAAIAIGITFLTGNLHVDFSSDAAADHTIIHCLDQELGGFAEPFDTFTVDDILVLRDDPDFDIDDLTALIGGLRTCFSGVADIPDLPPSP